MDTHKPTALKDLYYTMNHSTLQTLQWQNLLAKLQKIRLFAMDVDGVLTDGKITYDNTGNEIKSFHVHDGLGLSALKQEGIILAIITGRSSMIVEKRAKELGIEHIIQERNDKLTALNELSIQLNIPLNECAYIGDDLPDVQAIIAAGVGFSVANACKQAQHHADFVTHQYGGHGAVREVCEIILQAKNKYDDFLLSFGAMS